MNQELRSELRSELRDEIFINKKTNSLAQLLKEQTLQLDSWKNEHFSLTPGGMNSSAQLLEIDQISVEPSGQSGSTNRSI
ncbi:hypothetical protein C1645_823038 [Glomus cerebriforme]|uniref:Uncharacterized protein n=1 Tax=Glomus cerebriforme TaxID=658196 RepID=A0A397T1B3_9GLOM|nr:hypothetical protein C1645_823038 [Glomus cerebriforme]